jgi:UDP-glucose 4-epimerase
MFGSAFVTGASGFIGRALSRALIDRGCEVTTVGRGRSSGVAGTRHIRITSWEPRAIRRALADERGEVLFHLAAAGVAPDDRDLDTLVAVNVAATGAFVEAAAGVATRAIVYAGSCSEYGPVKEGVLVGEDEPLTSEETYGASKASGGLWGRAVARRHGVAFCWMRLFGVYGPGEAEHRLIPYVVRKLRAGQKVDLTPGKQVRDLMYIDDAVEGLISAALGALEGQVGPFNLCTGRPVAVAEVASRVAEIMRQPQDRLTFGARPCRPGEPLWLVGNPGRFGAATGFAPRVDLEEGMRRSISSI